MRADLYETYALSLHVQVLSPSPCPGVGTEDPEIRVKKRSRGRRYFCERPVTSGNSFELNEIIYVIHTLINWRYNPELKFFVIIHVML